MAKTEGAIYDFINTLNCLQILLPNLRYYCCMKRKDNLQKDMYLLYQRKSNMRKQCYISKLLIEGDGGQFT